MQKNGSQMGLTDSIVCNRIIMKWHTGNETKFNLDDNEKYNFAMIYSVPQPALKYSIQLGC